MSKPNAKKPVLAPPRPRLLSTRRSKERVAAFVGLAVAVVVVALLLGGLHSSYQDVVRVFSWTALAAAICFINVKLPSDRKRPAPVKQPSSRRRARR
jgi:protein-S-isoprenylcysteine O-methyltransferase Ste14